MNLSERCVYFLCIYMPSLDAPGRMRQKIWIHQPYGKTINTKFWKWDYRLLLKREKRNSVTTRRNTSALEEKKEENVYLHLLKNKVTIQWREKFKLEDVISHGFKPRGTWTWTITWITWISGPNKVWEFQ